MNLNKFKDQKESEEVSEESLPNTPVENNSDDIFFDVGADGPKDITELKIDQDDESLNILDINEEDILNTIDDVQLSEEDIRPPAKHENNMFSFGMPTRGIGGPNGTNFSFKENHAEVVISCESTPADFELMIGYLGSVEEDYTACITLAHYGAKYHPEVKALAGAIALTKAKVCVRLNWCTSIEELLCYFKADTRELNTEIIIIEQPAIHAWGDYVQAEQMMAARQLDVAGYLDELKQYMDFDSVAEQFYKEKKSIVLDKDKFSSLVKTK